MLPADDPDLVRSLAVVDATITRTTAAGDGFLRYNGDGYGDGVRPTGHPWAPTNKGTGTSGRCSRASAASRSSATGDAAPPSRG